MLVAYQQPRISLTRVAHKGATLLFFFIIFSCTHKDEQIFLKDPNFETIEFNPDTVSDQFKTSVWADKVQILTLDDSIEKIGKVDDLIVSGDILFILSNNSIYKFSDKGFFISKLSAIGKGPGEYSGISNLKYDSNKRQIIVFDDLSDKLLYYDFNLKHVKTISHSLTDESFIDGKYLFCFFNNTTGLFNNADKYYNVGIYLLNGKIEKTIFEIPKSDLWFTYSTKHCFYSGFQENYFIHPLDNHIYSIHANEVLIRYFVDFGKFNLPNTYLDGIADAQQKISKLAQSRFAYSIDNFVDLKDFVYLTYVFQNQLVNVLYGKSNKHVVTGMTLNDDKFGLPIQIPITAFDNKLVFIVEPFFIHYIIKELDKQFGKTASDSLINTKYKLVRQLGDRVTVDGNPIVAIYDIKN